jgi:uncharacterized protein YndB with AHSA1/START domain
MPGGRYRIELRHKNGRVHFVGGRYLEVKRPERLALTWKWEDPGAAEETQITVEVREQGKNTDLILSHQKFNGAEERDQHEQGWTG